MNINNLLKRITCCIFFATGYFTFAQVNLVPNWSFENLAPLSWDSVHGCGLPLGGFNLGLIPPWNSPTQGGSADPFDTCAYPVSSASVPLSLYGYQQPHSGGGMAAETFYYVGIPDYREYIQVPLDSTLIESHHYCISFFVNLADTVNVACNNFGMYISDSILNLSINTNIPVIPQINDTNIISDQFNWTEISGEYIAHGGEKYIMIGNFYDNSSTNIVPVSGWTNGAYYFIDDVSLVDCTPVGISEGKNGMEVEVYPNPATNSINITTNKITDGEITVYNLLGEVVLKSKVKSQKLLNNPTQTEGTETLDISQLANGLYQIVVEGKNGEMAKGKFIKE